MTSSLDTPTRLDLLIGGTSVTTAAMSEVRDPGRSDDVVGIVAAATPEDSRRAVDAAHAAFAGWSRLSATERAAQVRAALSPVTAAVPTLAETLTRENGKILQESFIDLAVFDARCRAAADLADSFEPVVTLPAPPFHSRVHRLPAGVVTIIVPFNWPAAILGASLPHALVAGNTVVVKPPPTAPLVLTRVLTLMAAELPPGVLNVVTGDVVGVEPLLTDPRVRHVVFTGSTAGGRVVMASAAQSLAKLTLELGGNDPAILLDDVDLAPATVDDLLGATFMSTGQVCMAVKRVYVPRSRFDETVGAFGAALSRHVVGYGLAEGTTLGPLNNARQLRVVGDMLAEARAAGAEVREFGELAADAGAGHFVRPSLVVDPDPGLSVVGEEQFGPALPVLPYDDLDDLLTRLDAEWSGLCSSVWSPDLDRARVVADRMRTGTTWINQANAAACDDRAPFGGFRQSGVGRELGLDGLLEFSEAHVVTEPAP